MTATPVPDHEELQALLGAYALDAVDDDERAVVDDHLATCARCRAEVADHRETAALLAFAGQEAPPGVWERIAASLEEPPPPVSISVARGGRQSAVRSLGRRSWVAGAVAAAAVVVSVVALTVSLRGSGGNDGGDSASLALPDGPRIVLRSSDGTHSADVVLAEDGGQGVVTNDNLPALPEGEVYQLWGKRGSTLVSLGLLGRDPERQRFVAGGDFEAFAITAERWPGVVTSQRAPVVAGAATSS